jgi:methylenetetrahydrofolate--tRNA-(uracil-5-)-methyltransferase
MFPALKNAEFVRYGVMHRNTFINSPQLLNNDFSLKKDDRIYFAGQISGVEGYMESASSGILAGFNLAARILGEEKLVLPKITMMGALVDYISDETVKNFQPMGAAFGIVTPLDEKIRDKKERYEALAKRSLQYFDTLNL